MKFISTTFLSIAVLASCSTAPPVDENAEAIRNVETGLCNRVYLEGDSTWTIDERMVHYGVPGMSIAVIKDNKIAWVKSYGAVNKETKVPVTDSTLFQAGSVSKPVAAYGALKMVELGLLGLDTDVNTYLRSWKLPDNAFTAQQKVTLKHLLSHTGGVSVHGFLGYTPDEPVPTLLQVLNGEPPANSAPIIVDKTIGEGYRYSGGGYCIAQQMMIDAKGGNFPDIMDELVLAPLGMTRSTYAQPLTGERLARAATGYLPDGSMTRGERHTYPEMAPAGLWTTAEDLAKFAIDLQRGYMGQGGAVLSKETATQMLTPFVGEANGLGIFLDKVRDDTYFEHGGWDEGFCAQLTAHRDKGYGAIVMINANQPEFISEVIRSISRAYGWDNYVPTYTKLKSDPALLETVSGRYRASRDAIVTVSHTGGQLFMQHMGRDAEELFRITDSTWISRQDRRPIQFKRGADDAVEALLTLDEEDASVESSRPRMADTEFVPFEFVLAGKPLKALAAYRALKTAEPEDRATAEERLNNWGYDLLGQGKTVMARDLFYVNMMLYPKSSNVYDSYAEACLKNGEEGLALINYKKSFAMDPKNANAAKVIKELEAKKAAR